MKRITEQEIQRAIQDHLTAEGILWWRCNLGGVRRSGKGWTKNPMAGFPDLAGILRHTRGRFFVVEVKRPGEVPKPHQADWHRKLEACGVLVIVASSVMDVRVAMLGAVCDEARALLERPLDVRKTSEPARETPEIADGF